MYPLAKKLLGETSFSSKPLVLLHSPPGRTRPHRAVFGERRYQSQLT